MWRNIKKFNPQKKFKTWIFSVAKNTAVDFFKKKKIIPFSELEDKESEDSIAETLIDPTPLPSELIERANINQILNSAVDKLPPKYRLVLFLYYNDHFNFREIAEVLGEPIDTIKSRHRRGLIRLKKIFVSTS
jgi:RNA polymerase sigma-70 factor (ECF subfamily)